jgi:hypothetical protein
MARENHKHRQEAEHIEQLLERSRSANAPKERTQTDSGDQRGKDQPSKGGREQNDLQGENGTTTPSIATMGRGAEEKACTVLLGG